MIFRPELAKLIVQGRKSMTRRQIGDRPVCRYEVGRAYAVQPGRGKLAVCRITVTEVRRERLGDMPIEDAKREGFPTRDEFFDYWRNLYGSVNRDLEVWAIRFLLGDRTDTARYLAARMGGSEGDYTTNRHRGINEPLAEPVSDAELERYGKLAHARDMERSKDPYRQGREAIARELDRMREHLQREPNEDVARTVRRLERELQVLDRKIAA